MLLFSILFQFYYGWHQVNAYLGIVQILFVEFKVQIKSIIVKSCTIKSLLAHKISFGLKYPDWLPTTL